MFLKKRDHLGETMVAALMAETFAPVPDAELVQISEYYAGKLDDLLAVNRRHERELSEQLTDITERLRQTRLVIASLEPAQAALAGDIAS